jgi:hypothetical protein
MVRWGVLLSMLLLTLGFAPAPLPRVERRPRPPSDVEGLWLGGASDGGDLRQETVRVRITADSMICSPDTKPFVYLMRLDRSRRPATYYLEGVAGMSSQGEKSRGLWRVEGDVLTMTYNPFPAPLPTAFEGPGKGQIVEVYRRIGR